MSTILGKKTFENIMGEGENADYQSFGLSVYKQLELGQIINTGSDYRLSVTSSEKEKMLLEICIFLLLLQYF